MVKKTDQNQNTLFISFYARVLFMVVCAGQGFVYGGHDVVIGVCERERERVCVLMRRAACGRGEKVGGLMPRLLA